MPAVPAVPRPRALDLTWTVRDDADATRLLLTGALDLSTEPTMWALGDDLLTMARRPVLLDLSGVDFCDARGLRSLLQLRQRVLDADRCLAIVNARPLVRRVFEIVGQSAVLEAPSDPAPIQPPP